MKRYPLLSTLVLLAACGGGDAPGTSSGAPAASTPAPAPAPAAAMPARPTGALSIPDWYSVDNAARTVRMTIVAGLTPDNNHWNFNGAIKGSREIVVPVGYAIAITLENRDPNMAHSLGIQANYTDPMIPPTPNPAFPGAITPNPGSMIDGTMPGQTVTINFVADKAGQYTMLCYVAGHTALGMYLYFDVSADGEAGVRGL